MADHSLQYTKEGIPILRKSCLEDFSWCPRKFQIVWLEERPVEANLMMLMGTRFHDFANSFFDYWELSSPEHWEDMIPKEFVPQEVSMARWFIQNERERYYKLEDDFLFMPILREFKIEDSKLNIESTLDRVDWVDPDEHTVKIVEYKTGGNVNTNWDTIRRQIAFYSILYERNIGTTDTVSHMGYINPRIGVDKTLAFTPPMKVIAYDLLNSLRASIRDDYFPCVCTNNKYPFCKLCSLDTALPQIEMPSFDDDENESENDLECNLHT